jgi:NADH dehydrogenase
LLNALHRLPQAIVARPLKARLRGADLLPFCYRDFGTMATIGRKRTVVQLGRLKLSGFPAWALWSIPHIYFLIGFRNRLLVAMN